MFLIKRRGASDRTDEELIQAYRDRNDREAIGILFEKYTHLVLGVCIKYLHDAETSKDAVMNIFEKLMTDLKRQEIGNFKPWLHAVTRNHCLMMIRDRKQAAKQATEFHRGEKDFVELRDELHQSNGKYSEEQLKKLDRAIAKLGYEQKTCIRMFYFEDKSYAEIVELTGFEQGKVKSYIQNAKRNLKIKLEKNFRKGGGRND